MAKKLPHGGKRNGAGRPPFDPNGTRKVIAVTIPPALIARLDEFAAQKSWSRSEAITEAIRGMLDTK